MQIHSIQDSLVLAGSYGGSPFAFINFSGCNINCKTCPVSNISQPEDTEKSPENQAQDVGCKQQDRLDTRTSPGRPIREVAGKCQRLGNFAEQVLGKSYPRLEVRQLFEGRMHRVAPGARGKSGASCRRSAQAFCR